jgi:D-alanine-D-alanine ligase
MDKDVMKRLLRDAGIPIARFVTLHRQDDVPPFHRAELELGVPFFVKPANMGSSVGVSKVHNAEEYRKALDLAFSFDLKLILEENVPGRELECALLGNHKPLVSVVGEVKSNHDFYSYEAKYLDENGAVLEIPAILPADVTKKVQDTAIRSFQVLACEGLGRVDLFLKDDGQIVVNEINTIPGFTKISMYPKLWEASGVSYEELIDRLIGLALARFEKESHLKTKYE